MAENSKIEWTDHTFNPWIGCTKVSPGCVNCYAETATPTRTARAKGRELWGKGQPRQRTSEDYWKGPLRWNGAGPLCVDCGTPVRNTGVAIDCQCGQMGAIGKGRRPRVFCASLADVFDREVSIGWLADLLQLIHDTPNLDWLLVTKRPEDALERLTLLRQAWAGEHSNPHWAWLDDWLAGTTPENVWIGTTVEDQARADERIPALLRIPARVRFLSCEPLLGAVNLDEWIKPFVCCSACGSSYELSEAVPDADGHPHGADMCKDCGRENHMTSCWGESAQLHWLEEGTHVTEPEEYGGGIHWVIAGGESGPGARPMHPDWARSLRDQCAAAGVPFFFKQWGGWKPCELTGDHAAKEHVFQDGTAMLPCNKKAAGRLLDGREWSQYP